MCPLTRRRSPGGVPNALVQEYYRQRADGNLIFTEGTFIAAEAGGLPGAPGIYSQEQVQAWKRVVDAVHERNGVIFCQLWALGRANKLEDPDNAPVVFGPSCIPSPLPGSKPPQTMTREDITRYKDHFRNAAKCAMEAGFDGVELHGAHGYLLDQFIQASSNNRSDEYGGNMENRCRFALEALEVVCGEIGQNRTGIRISPFSPFSGMGDEPLETFEYLCLEIKKRFPRLAHISVTEPRDNYLRRGKGEKVKDSMRFSSDRLRAIIRGIDHSGISLFARDEPDRTFPDPNPENPTVFVSAGGYTAADAEACCSRTGDVLGYGRLSISNPDLAARIKRGADLNPYDRSTFYTTGKEGYTDYSFSSSSKL
ncbi:MAG: hypothetical protein SGCHY_000834 [Lobulomycetales sp.]